jgi:integrase/recombinase XerD
MRCHNRNDEVLDLAERSLEQAIRETTSVFRRHRLSYDQTIYVTKRARAALAIEQKRPAKRLPKNLTREQLRAFFASVDAAGVAEHSLLFRLMLYTGMRVAELCAVRRDALDVENCQIRIVQGKNSKDRVVLFPTDLRLALRLHLERTQDRTWLFETIRRRPYSVRWMQELCSRYGDAAGVERMHCHRLRHSLMTELARPGVNQDGTPRAPISAELRAILAGHASAKTQEVYTHLALGDVADAYQDAVKSLI